MKRIPSALLVLLPAAFSSCNDSGDGSGGLVGYAGPQTGTLAVDLASGEVSVLLAPQAFLVSGAASYDGPTETLGLSLTLRNGSTSIVAGTKLLVTQASEGVVAADGHFGPLPAVPYVYYGPESILPGTSVTRTFDLTGVTGAAPVVTLDFEIVNHGWIFMPGDFDLITAADASGVGEDLVVDGESLSFMSADIRFDPVHATADGRHVYFACRNQPALARLDLATLDLTIGSSLIGGTIDFDQTGVVGCADSVVPSPDGAFLYAVVQDGAHVFRFALNYPPPSVRLYKLHADSLAVVASLLIEPSVIIPTSGEGGAAYVEYRGRALSITADGTLGALAVTGLGEVHLVDLTGSMALVDQDPLTGGFQGFDVSGTSTEVRRAAIAPDGSRIYVAYAGAVADANDGTLDVIDVATGGISTLAPPSLSGARNAPTELRFGPDGRLYYGRAKDPTVGLSIYDPAALTWHQAVEPSDGNALAFGEGVYYVFDAVTNRITAYDLATDALLETEDAGTSVQATSAAAGHGMVVTPAF